VVEGKRIAPGGKLKLSMTNWSPVEEFALYPEVPHPGTRVERTSNRAGIDLGEVRRPRPAATSASESSVTTEDVVAWP